MIRLARKNLSANLLRLALTGIAIVLGVGFVVSSFVLRDGLRASFEDLSAEIAQGTDLLITTFSDDVLLTDEDITTVNSQPGVRTAVGSITAFDNSVIPILDDGTAIPTGNGPPVIGFSWNDDEILNPTTLETGRTPNQPNEWVVDIGAAEKNNLVVGNDYDLITPVGTRTATLVGTFRFGQDNSTNGATLMGFELTTAREYFGIPTGWEDISVSIDGSVPVDELQSTVSTALGNETLISGDVDGAVADGNRVRVQNNADVQAEQAASFNTFIDVFGWILRVFALITLFVSTFIIANTFAIVTSQRIRELGLLRAVGATPSQILRSVLAESFVIGVVASMLGIVLGFGLAYLVRAVLNAFGLELPEFDIVVSGATIFWGMFVGILVTMISAIVPALSASRVSPITAITGSADAKERSRLRYILGALVSAVGIGLLLLALFGLSGTQPVLISLGAGAAILFIGITMLSPLAAAPLSRVLGAPLGKIFGTPGSLSKENAARNPRRTSSTAAALMIGLSLVSMAMVLGSSLKTEINKIFDEGVDAEYVVNTSAFNIPDEVRETLLADPAFGAVTNVRFWGAELTNQRVGEPDNGELTGVNIASLNFDDGSEIFLLGETTGDLRDVDHDSVAIDDDLAESLGVGFGDDINMVLESGEVAELEIVAIFETPGFLSEMLITESRFFEISDQKTSDFVYVQKSDGVSDVDAAARFQEIGAAYPTFDFQSSDEAAQSFTAIIDQLLAVLQALLGLAILIALFGIANTMALSVVERTREIGLLRAVGMTRKQARRMIRWEAAIVSTFGAVLGALIGLGLGILLVNAIPDSVLSSFSIPWLQIIIMVVVSSVAGLISALLPAFRASRMNVLDAISHV